MNTTTADARTTDPGPNGHTSGTRDPRLWGFFKRLEELQAGEIENKGLYDGFHSLLYDRTTFADDRDVAVYLECAQDATGPVLELGCGSGRILLRLAKAGHEVVGVDLSEDMLAVLQRRLGQLPEEIATRVTGVQGDGATVDLDRRFDLVLLPALGISLFTSAEDRARLLANVRRHVADDGRFVLDFPVFTDEQVEQLDGHVACMEIPVRDGVMLNTFGMRFNEERTFWDANSYTLHVAGGGRLRQGVGSFRYARIVQAELDAQLADAGFRIERREEHGHRVGDVEGRRVVYVCRPTSPTRLDYPLWHPWLAMNGIEDDVLMLERGEGTRVWDRDGREYLDLSGGLWSTQCGLGRREIIDAVTRQLETLSYGTLFARRGNAPSLELARRLVALAPDPLAWVYLTGSGSESVELAMKLVRLEAHVTGRPERTEIVYLDRSYHGTYYGSVGVTALVDGKERLGPHLPGLSSIRAPIAPPGVEPQAYAIDCARDLQRRIEESGDRVAAVIMEPILGSAGVSIPPRAYFDEIQRICREHGVRLILDEVATGFGRTGRMFAAEHFGLAPDVMLLSKGINSGYLPLGAVLFARDLGERLLAAGVGIGHGSSANGNPACSVSALANIDIIEREGLIERSREVGAAFLEGLATLREHDVVADVRGIGLMLAIELCQQGEDGPVPVTAIQNHTIAAALAERGLLPYPFASGFSFLPALTIERADVDATVAGFHDVLGGLVLRDGRLGRKRSP